MTFVVGALLAALLAMHELVPTSYGLALAVESMLPWTWVIIVLIFIVALFRFSAFSIVGVLLPAIVWLTMFGGYLRPAQTPAEADITVATQNVGARMPQPTATAKNLIAADPDIVAMQEIESLSGEIISEQLSGHYPHATVADTIGVWSKWPMSEPREIDLGIQWPRAFVTTISTDHGDVSFYSVHLPSVRPGEESLRNSALSRLSESIAADDADRVIVAGDFNASSTDRYFEQLDEQLVGTREAVGGGFGFTWPSLFPVVRLDHIMVRGLEPVGDEVLDRGTSDHRAVLGHLNIE
ncbi:teicoplanin resistance protein VanJ [Brevibacterium daeguense]|uniref:Teicoplanin resistance protein VanJ n=2 Tax=Brevibacterium daeguense TaxID=909936 RepID=A0ABP8EKQ5_9MICO